MREFWERPVAGVVTKGFGWLRVRRHNGNGLNCDVGWLGLGPRAAAIRGARQNGAPHGDPGQRGGTQESEQCKPHAVEYG